MAAVIKSIKAAGGGDYTTLAAWETDRQGNLITRDTIEVAEVYGGGSVGNVTLDSTNWTVDATHYPQIRAASGHECGGVWDTNKAYTGTITGNSVGYFKVGPGLSAGTVRHNSTSGDTPCLVERCVIRGDSYGVLFASGGGTNSHAVRNCIIYKLTTGSGLSGVYSTGPKVLVHNCTIVVPSGGFTCLGNGSVITSQNNYLSCGAGAAVCYYGAVNKGANDATSNTEAPTVSLRNIAYSNANFTNTGDGTEDLHLTNTSALRMVGATLGDVLDDIDGDSRIGLVYDIGADQQSDIPVCWNYTAKFKGSKKLFKTSGGGAFPRNLRVPGNVDKSTGRMIDDGKEIDPDHYEVF